MSSVNLLNVLQSMALAAKTEGAGAEDGSAGNGLFGQHMSRLVNGASGKGQKHQGQNAGAAAAVKPVSVKLAQGLAGAGAAAGGAAIEAQAAITPVDGLPVPGQLVTGEDPVSSVKAGKDDKSRKSTAEADDHDEKAGPVAVLSDMIGAMMEGASAASRGRAQGTALAGAGHQDASRESPLPNVNSAAADGVIPQTADDLPQKDLSRLLAGLDLDALKPERPDVGSDQPQGAFTLPKTSVHVVSQTTILPPVITTENLGRIADAVVAAAPDLSPTQTRSLGSDLQAGLQAHTLVKTLTVELKPVELGVLNIHMKLTGNVLEVQIAAQHQDTRRMLLADQDRLTQILNQAGITTGGDVVVRIASPDGSSAQMGAGQQGQSGGFGSGSGSGGFGSDGQGFSAGADVSGGQAFGGQAFGGRGDGNRDRQPESGPGVAYGDGTLNKDKGGDEDNLSRVSRAGELYL